MTAFWLWWGIIVLVSFGIGEYVGYKRYGTRGTLSYKFWCVMFRDADDSLRGEPVNEPRAFSWFIVTALLAWLLAHMSSGGLV